ncbi:hypothetical protein [Virgibacillus sp. Bac332]|nr:hypothetical protein [Virgibacillus sp. Bac332]
MKLLTTENLTELELLNNALRNEGLKEISKETEINRLGEGAWHHAYLIEKEQLVLRIPKRVAYDKEVVFNRKALTSEYAATKAFYQHANRAKEGVCPEQFKFFVDEKLTYTIESYLGKSIGLQRQTTDLSRRYGKELGAFFLALENLNSPYKGIGHLEIGQTGELKGELDMDLKAFVFEETKEYQEELNKLIDSPYEFDRAKVVKAGESFISRRSINDEKIILTNQDTSPENIIYTKRGAKIIDPYPLLYTGVSFAANYVFNYQALFHLFHNTKRYRKGNYHLYISQLIASAEGFIEGYTGSSKQKRHALHIEVFLKLLTMTYTHYKLVNETPLDREQIIRFGTKEQVEERLRIYLKKLEEYPK